MAQTPIQTPKWGEPIRADDMSRLAGGIQERNREGRSNAWGITAAIIAARDPDWFVKAFIQAVFPADANEVPHPAYQVSYNVVGVGRPDIAIYSATPYYGRPVKDQNHMIYGAAVDMDCVIVRSNYRDGSPRWRLMLLPDSEQRATRVCGQE